LQQSVEANNLTGEKEAASVPQLDFSQTDQCSTRVENVVKTSANTIPDKDGISHFFAFPFMFLLANRMFY